MENKEIEKDLTGCLTAWAFIPIALVLSGWVTMYLWNGIISVTFELQTLSFWQALGLDIFVSYLMVGGKGKEKRTSYEVFVSAITKTLLFLLLGFIVIHFV